MAQRLLQLDDICRMTSANNVSTIFNRLGYQTQDGAQPLDIRDLELPARSAEGIEEAHLIADQRQGSEALQVLLFQLSQEEWGTPGAVGQRMRSIAQSLSRRPSEFLLIGTKNYDHLMLVNPRKSFDARMDLKVGIRKLLIDRKLPTYHDRDRLEAIAAKGLSPQAIYKNQCDAFDVEKLTKAFYEGYKKLFDQVRQCIANHNSHPYFDDASRLHQFSQRFLGRIMFLYFLQKKEFLAGDRDFLRTQFRPFNRDLENTNFYSDVLEPLFFEMLNKDRPDFASPWGKIPYLNGGLFERDYGPDVLDTAGFQTPLKLDLPNSLFDSGSENGILKFFGNYNFTVAENIQGDEDAAIDPETLGKVFENMLAAEERGQSGTFYTPRGIVQFMCVESLSRYLADESGVDLEVVKQLAEYDTDTTDAELKQLITKDQTSKLKRALETVKVCDPAVGSGAFPLGMMQVILAVYQAIGRREGETLRRGSLAMSRLKRKIIANNLYGVDIKPEAIEIAKLRLWLSMVVDIPSIDDVEALPNLDYKLMAGNSLISTISGETLIPDPSKTLEQGLLAVTPIQIAIQPLRDLQNSYFAAHTDDRKDLGKQIRDAEINVFRVAIADRRQYWQGELRKIEDIKQIGKITPAQAKKEQAIVAKLKELDSVEQDVARGLRSLDFFQWHLHFNDVFQEKGGFDIVIGNPPYVRHERLSAQFKDALKTEFPDLFKGTADIYTYFYGKAINLLHQGGKLAFISPSRWFRAEYGVSLRKHISDICQVYNITDFGELPVFDAATFPMIFVAQKGKISNEPTLFTQVKSLEPPYPNISTIVRGQAQILPTCAIDGMNWTLTNAQSAYLLQKVETVGSPLSSLANCQMFNGVKPGLNEAFVIDNATRLRLIQEDPSCEQIIFPYPTGDHVRKYFIREPESFLIYIKWSDKFEAEHPVIEYLSQFKEKLSKRDGVKNNGSCPWYALSRPRPESFPLFKKRKIVYPLIASKSRFTLDDRKFIPSNLVYCLVADDLLYILGILNSSVIWEYLKQKCTVIGDQDNRGRLQLTTSILERLPVPKALPSDGQAISALVQKCLDAKGQNISHLEAEINDRVARLYGLTPDEIELITKN